MLARSPPFPIVIDHFHKDNGERMTANDVEGIKLALEHHDCVHRICFRTPFSMTKEVVDLLDGEFPVLEYLCITPIHYMRFPFPKTFHAPRLRYLTLNHVTCPIGSPLLSAAVGLVALSLVNISPSTYFQPDELRH